MDKILKNLLVLMIISIVMLLIGVNYLYTNINKMKLKLSKIKTESVAKCEDEKNAIISKYNNDIESLKVNYNSIFNNRDNLKKYIMYINNKIYPELAETIVDESIKMGKKYKISPFLYIMFMDVESDFYPYATNLKGKIIGLMQINSAVWYHNGKEYQPLKKNGIINKKAELFYPRKNIQAGAYIIDYYKNKCTKMKEKDYNKFSKKYSSILNCTAKSYFGGNYESYYKKLKMSIGNYWFFLQTL